MKDMSKANANVSKVNPLRSISSERGIKLSKSAGRKSYRAPPVTKKMRNSYSASVKNKGSLAGFGTELGARSSSGEGKPTLDKLEEVKE